MQFWVVKFNVSDDGRSLPSKEFRYSTYTEAYKKFREYADSLEKSKCVDVQLDRYIGSSRMETLNRAMLCM